MTSPCGVRYCSCVLSSVLVSAAWIARYWDCASESASKGKIDLPLDLALRAVLGRPRRAIHRRTIAQMLTGILPALGLHVALNVGRLSSEQGFRVVWLLRRAISIQDGDRLAGERNVMRPTHFPFARREESIPPTAGRFLNLPHVGVWCCRGDRRSRDLVAEVSALQRALGQRSADRANADMQSFADGSTGANRSTGSPAPARMAEIGWSLSPKRPWTTTASSSQRRAEPRDWRDLRPQCARVAEAPQTHTVFVFCVATPTRGAAGSRIDLGTAVLAGQKRPAARSKSLTSHPDSEERTGFRFEGEHVYGRSAARMPLPGGSLAPAIEPIRRSRQ
jgi:hypothetical protein